MTVFENLSNKTIDELVEWFDKHIEFDNAPWVKWWDKNYCSKCISEISFEFGHEHNCAWCESHDTCKFFPEMKTIPDSKQTIKLWLESEEIEDVEE